MIRSPLQSGRRIVTLLDAGVYINDFPKAEQQLDDWQTASGACSVPPKVGTNAPASDVASTSNGKHQSLGEIAEALTHTRRLSAV
jgi:hypothetical protein